MNVKLCPDFLLHLNTRILIKPIKPLIEAIAPMVVGLIDIFERVAGVQEYGSRNNIPVVFLYEETQEEAREIHGVKLTCRRVNTHLLDTRRKRKITKVRRTYYLTSGT